MTARVLVVEDDRDLREILELALVQEGYDVEAATDAVDGLVRLEFDPRPDVIVTDLLMPVVPGTDLVEVLRRDPRFAPIPILVVTGAPVPASVTRTADAVLTKPFDLEQLLAAIAAVAPRGTS